MLVSCLLLLALFVIRPQARRLRGRISQSISQGLGKRVEIGAAHLRFLPRPGFELKNVVIHDDLEFGAEPLLRSPEVTAWLRVTPLLRGRLEISRLSLTDASLNLTRGPQGPWNIQDLLERTSRFAAAPRASKKSRPQFPYIEAVGTRINLKIESEKTHFALTNAEFALWQDSENTWGMRLRAQPIRTDANLTDTGKINVSGTWRRASSPAEAPLQFVFQWKQAQIGQISKLVYGTDLGWRGEWAVSGTIAGTPERLRVTADTTIDDFRRFDVFGGGNLRLLAHCGAEYRSAQQTLSDVDCNGPAGAGLLELKGSASGSRLSSYRISVLATKIPARNLLSVARHTRKNIPDDLNASGQFSATVSLHHDEGSQPPEFDLNGEIQNLQLASSETGSPLTVGTVPFSMAKVPKAHGRAAKSAPALEIGPANVAMNRPAPLQVRASLSRAGYQISMHGDSGIKRLLQAANMLHIPVPAVVADGSSTLELELVGDWSGVRPTRPTGTIQLRSASARVAGLNAPLQITSATLVLDQDYIHVQNLSASAAQATWHGSMQLSRPCSTPGACRTQFNLRAGEVSSAALNAFFNPKAGKQSWYNFFSPGANPVPYLLQARAEGKIAIDKLALGRAECTHFAGDLELAAGKLTLSHAKGEIWGGTATADLKADFLSRPPAYSGSGGLETVSLSKLAELMRDEWIAGSGAATYEFKSAGWTLQELIESADLNAGFAITDGDFPHVVLTSTAGAVRGSDFSGQILLRKGRFSLDEAKLASSDGVYRVSGTASLGGVLNLVIAGENTPVYNVTGTLTDPRVSKVAAAAAQASLKP